MAADFDQKRQELTQRIVDKIVSDPKFRAAIVADTNQALNNSEFGKDLHELVSTASSGDVSGYSAASPNYLDSWVCAK